MGRPQIAVQQFLLAKNLSTFGPTPVQEFNLLGVSYRYTVPAGTAFDEDKGLVWPRPVVFLRVHARDAGTTNFVIQVHWERESGAWEPTNQYPDKGRPFNFPKRGNQVLEEHIRLEYITLKGFGRYAVTIYFRPGESEVDADDADEAEEETELHPWEEWERDKEEEETTSLPWDPIEPGWILGAVDYFCVVKP